MKEIPTPKSFTLVVTEDPQVGGYTIECPQMPGCVSEADTLPELYRNWADAATLWFQAAAEDVAAGRDPFRPNLPATREMALA